jgi:hypothetical protein
MNKPTNRDLLNFLLKMPEEHLDDNLTVYDAEEDEFYPVNKIENETQTDVLDEGCMFFSIKE